MLRILLLLFLFGLNSEASLIGEVHAHQLKQVLQKACDIEIKEGLLPVQCSKIKAYSQNQLKILCLQAVSSINKPQQLDKTKLDLQVLDPYCLQKIETKRLDLEYKQRKAALWTTHSEDSQ